MLEQLLWEQYGLLANSIIKSAASNRHIYLHQAKFSTQLLRWFENFGADLEEKLRDRFITQQE